MLAIEMKKLNVKINKPVYLGLSILEISKTLMHEFCIVILNQSINKMKNFVTWIIIHIKIEDIYKDITNDVEKRFDTSNYEVNRPLPTEKNKKIIGLMKDELGGKIMTEFVALRPKIYSYLKRQRNKKMCNKTNTQV